jgi:ATP-dependent Zn protease
MLASKILRDHKHELDLLVAALLEYETLTGDEVLQVISGKRIERPVVAAPQVASE